MTKLDAPVIPHMGWNTVDAAAGSTLGRYFDPASRRTQAAATLLQQVQGFTREADVPRVDATLNALAKAGAAQAAPVPSGKSR